MVAGKLCFVLGIVYLAYVDAVPTLRDEKSVPGYRTLLEKAKRDLVPNVSLRDVSMSAPGMRALEKFARSVSSRSAEAPGYRTLLEKAKRGLQMQTRKAPGRSLVEKFANRDLSRSAEAPGRSLLETFASRDVSRSKEGYRTLLEKAKRELQMETRETPGRSLLEKFAKRDVSRSKEGLDTAPGYRTLLEKARRELQMETREAPGRSLLEKFAKRDVSRSKEAEMAAIGLREENLSKKDSDVSVRSTDCDAVVFNAYHAADKVLSDEEKIVFENIEYNTGDAYNPSTGVFTAPSSGLYTFSTFLCTPTDYYLYFKIKTSSGKTLLKGSNHDGTYKSCVSGTVYVLLEQGEDVWVESNNDSSDEVLLEDWWRANRFTGALIR